LFLYNNNYLSKKNIMARTSTYLNFANSTEEAFNFYKSIFGGEFIGKGISRFGDIPVHDGAPPMPEELKNLVMHVELAITGGHVIMGTDAPEQMGFTVNFGNAMHLNIEPDTIAETDRLFAALSEGGKIIHPLGRMFWDAYFGSCTDKFGTNWMVNCYAK
jgi:PhnB protein